MKRFSVKVIGLITTLCILLAFLCSCQSHQDKIRYYSEKENYISVTGIVQHIKYSEDSSELYIGFSELSPVLDDDCFKIVGNNLKIVQNSKIDEKLKIDDEISFITAPKYYGDGYVMPIVAITINGEELLEFDEGYENLIDWLSEGK